MIPEKETKPKNRVRQKANKAKKFRCKDLIAVLEAPKYLGNVGSVIRNIDSLGVSKLYIIDSHKRLPSTWEEMKTEKALNDTSCSAIQWVFVKTFQNTWEGLEHLKKKGYVSFATSPHQKTKKNINLCEGNFTQKKLAIWFGNESKGLSPTALDACEACIQIPMAGIIESLNLATASGIVLYEITKQRRNFSDKLKESKKTPFK